MFPIEKVAAPPSVRRTVFAGALGNGEGKEKKTLSCSQGKKMRVTVVLENVHFNYRTSVLIRRKKKNYARETGRTASEQFKADMI